MVKIVMHFFLILFSVSLCAQQVAIPTPKKFLTLTECLELFNFEHQLLFSYSNEITDNIKIPLNGNNLSIEYLQVWLKNNTEYRLENNSPTTWSLLSAQDPFMYNGVVKDFYSKKAKSLAKITNTTNNQFTYTDDFGKFSILLNSSKDSLLITDTSNQWYKTSNDERQGVLWLSPEVEFLNEVLVKNYVREGIKKNRDGAIELFKNKQKILPGIIDQDVLLNLQTLPGVSSPNENASQIYIRGGSPDQNNTLWNGIQIYQTGHFFDEISAFNPFVIAKTTFYKSGTNPKYGNRIGGVISLQTKTKAPEENKYHFGISSTNLEADAHVKLNEKVNLVLGVRRSIDDLVRSKNLSNINQKNFKTTDGSITLLNPTLEKDKTIYFADAALAVNIAFDATNFLQFNAIGIENTFNNKSRDNLFEENFTLTNYGLGITSKNKWNAVLLESKVYFTNYSFNFNNDLVFSTEESERLQKRTNLSEFNYISTALVELNKKHKLTFGYQFQYNDLEINFNETRRVTDFFNTGSFNTEINEVEDLSILNTHALIGGWIYKNNSININIGTRLNYFSEVNKFFINPRVFTSLKVSSNATITGSAELKNQPLYQAFSLNSNRSIIANRFWVLAKNGTQNETEQRLATPVLNNHQFTLGYLFKYKNFHLDIEGYSYKASNISLFGLGFENIPFGESSQIPIDDDSVFKGSENRLGFDILINQKIKDYQLWLSYSNNKTELSFPLVSENKISGNFEQRHQFRISQAYVINNFDFGLSWFWSSGTPYSVPIGIEFDTIIFNEDSINTNRLPDYSRLDFSIVKKIRIKQTKQLTLGVSLKNLLNKKNILERYHEINLTTNSIQEVERKSLMFSPNFLLRYSF